ncbi:C2 domain [Trinorchestia longiramus]|nr:C2 domain [Trinorchestia longiramus]
MGRLDERLGAAPVSRFDFVAEPAELKKNVDDNELSLEEWYACCRSQAPQAASYEFFCRVWPDNALHPNSGLLQKSSTDQSGEQNSVGQTDADHLQQEEDVPAVSAHGSQRGSRGSSEATERLLSHSRVVHAVRCMYPVYVSKHTRDMEHKLVCFTPGTHAPEGASSVDTIERGEGCVEHRAAAAEGGGARNKPRLLRRNINKMVNRLRLQGNTGWRLSSSDEGHELVSDQPTEDVLYRQHQARDPGAAAESRKPLVRFVEAADRDASLSLLPACTVHLQLQHLIFEHHPLLAAEHLLAKRLTTAVRLYNDRIAQGHTELLLQKVKVLRTTLAGVNEDDQTSSTEPSDNGVHTSHAQRVDLYRSNLAETRKQLHASSLRDRQLLTEALNSWTELKELRQTQGYVVTPWMLNIKQSQSRDPEAERRWWREAQVVEVEELLQEEEVQHQQCLLQYQQQLVQWKKQRVEKKAAKRRLHLACAGAADSASQLQTAADTLFLASPLPPKPQPPPPPLTRQKVVEQVQSTFKRSLRPPGEPELQLLLSEAFEAVTASKLCPLQERRRRQAVARTDVAVKIFVNNKPVTQTSWRPLDDHHLKMVLDFPVVAATACEPRTLGLQLLQSTTSSPTTAKFRKVVVLDSYTCDLTRFSDLDSRRIRCRQRDLDVEFSSDEVFCYSHAGVGAGRDDAEHCNLLTRAWLSAQCRLWSGPADASLMSSGAPASSPQEAPALSPPEAPASSPQEAPASSPPEVPASSSPEASASSPQEASASSPQEASASFECDGETCGPEWLCSREALDSNLRHQLLRLRQQKAGHLGDMSRIPPLTSQILRATTTDGEAHLNRSSSSSTTQADDVQPSDADDDDWLDDVAEQLAGAQELVSSVRRRLLQRTAEAAAVPTPSDMVQEEQIPDIGSLGLSLVSLFRPKRPLKPDRKVRGVVRTGAGVVSSGRRVSLILNVARAFNVPVRDDLDLTSSLQQPQDEDVMPSVRPYVTVSFQGRHARTSVAHGPNPTWNQQLVLPFRCTGVQVYWCAGALVCRCTGAQVYWCADVKVCKCTGVQVCKCAGVPASENQGSAGLGLVRESIALQLFDERLLDDESSSTATAEALDDADGAGNTETVRTRLHNTWLASLCIPTAALLRNTCKIEGTFELSSPVSVLGYRRAVDGGARGLRGGSTTLTLYVTLEPALPQPPKIDAALPENIVSAGTVNTFKNRLDKFWITNPTPSTTSY